MYSWNATGVECDLSWKVANSDYQLLVVVNLEDSASASTSAPHQGTAPFLPCHAHRFEHRNGMDPHSNFWLCFFFRIRPRQSRADRWGLRFRARGSISTKTRHQIQWMLNENPIWAPQILTAADYHLHLTGVSDFISKNAQVPSPKSGLRDFSTRKSSTDFTCATVSTVGWIPRHIAPGPKIGSRPTKLETPATKYEATSRTWSVSRSWF